MIRLTRDFAPGIAAFIAALMLVCATGMPAAASQAVRAPSPSKAPPSHLAATSASLTPLTDKDLEVIRGEGIIWDWIKRILKEILDECRRWLEDWWKRIVPQIPMPYYAAEAGDEGCYEYEQDVTVDLYGLDPEECVEADIPEVDDVVTDGPDPSECGE